MGSTRNVARLAAAKLLMSAAIGAAQEVDRNLPSPSCHASADRALRLHTLFPPIAVDLQTDLGWADVVIGRHVLPPADLLIF